MIALNVLDPVLYFYLKDFLNGMTLLRYLNVTLYTKTIHSYRLTNKNISLGLTDLRIPSL